MEKSKLERVSLTLSVEDKAQWISYYKNKRDKLLIELGEINRNIAELSGEAIAKEQYKLPLEYSIDWNWPQKFEYVLRQAGKKLTVNEIIERLGKLEGADYSVTDAKNRINVAVHYQLKNGQLLTKEIIDNKSFIGLREWETKITATDISRLVGVKMKDPK